MILLPNCIYSQAFTQYPVSEMQVDLIDLCALLQCIGFKIKSVDTGDSAGSHEAGIGRTVSIVCNLSDMRVVLESTTTDCCCPVNKDENTSGFWQVSGVARGVVENNKETGSTLLGSLPQTSKEKLTRDLLKLIEYARKHLNTEDFLAPQVKGLSRSPRFYELKEAQPNVSSSLTDLNITPPAERRASVKIDTPTRYRSLDTLINVRNDSELPAPGELVPKSTTNSDNSDIAEELPKFKKTYRRQQTYTVSTPDKGNIMMKSKTSSPIKKVSDNMLQSILSAERTAEELKNKLAEIVKGVTSDDEKPHDSSVASLALDVSKISVHKGYEQPPKSKYVSSPNLSTNKHNEYSQLTRIDSSSATQLNVMRAMSLRGPSKLKKMSPSFFKKKTESVGDEGTYKRLSGIMKPRVSTSSSLVRTPSNKPIANDSGMSMSTTKKKMYSHVKSTIPKPTFLLKKDEPK